MNARVVQSGVALLLIVLSNSALAGNVWLPRPATLRLHMRTSRSVVVGRLTDVEVEERLAVVVARVTDVQVEQRLAMVRSGSGRIADEQIITGARVLPAVAWSDRTDTSAPSPRLDQFKDRINKILEDRAGKDLENIVAELEQTIHEPRNQLRNKPADRPGATPPAPSRRSARYVQSS